MSLTKWQRYQFHIDTKPTGWAYALAILKRASGTVILLATSSAIGWMYLIVSVPFTVWGVGAIHQFGPAVILLIFGSVFLSAMITSPLLMLNKYFRIHHPVVSALCPIIAIATLTARIATNNYDARTLVLSGIFFASALLPLWFFLGNSSDR
jgi:hypothetical protein